MHHEEELEESCSDHISVENHASDVSTSYNHVPIRLPSHEHINVNVSDTEEDEEEDEQDIDDEGQTGRMVSILSSSSSPPETSYRLTRENSRRLFWDAFSRRNSIRRHRGDSIAAAAADGLGSHDRFLFDFDLSADSSDDDQGNRIHSSSIQRLQSQSEALSKRIHYGKFVAEAKCRASLEDYTSAIKAQDRKWLMDLLTYPMVEEAVKRRVEIKSKTHGQEVVINQGDELVSGSDPNYRIKPNLVGDLYGDWIMPLTSPNNNNNNMLLDYLLLMYYKSMP
ncbi:chorismate mutase-like [Impatiens glandulifera]|uniref:chorismate mutase-like n=1 Tax=Impatiens glandulifera TaxID=253017 RepID=UPI001FB11025|nr:chorismate mutase-like [Impatiens glandulifera]